MNNKVGLGCLNFTLSFQEIAARVGGELVVPDGVAVSEVVSSVASVVDLTEHTLAYCDSVANLPSHQPASSLILISHAVGDQVMGAHILVASPRLAFARLVADLIGDLNCCDPGIHVQAVVADGTIISESAIVGAGAVIEAEAEIGAGVIIASGVFIGSGVVIGRDSVIHPGARILANSAIGSGCCIGANSVIGADGFGWVPNGDEFEYMPHLGRAVLGDKVSVGAGSVICRGTLEDTEIASGVKLDSMVMIAHNVTIGANTLVCGGSAVAGSAKIGANCMIGGLVGIIGHIEIVNRVMIGAGSMIGSSITTAGRYCARFPTFTVRQWARIGVFLKRSVEKSGKIK